MGKGTIQGGGEDGEYSVMVELDTATIADEISDLDEKISDLASQIAAAEEGLDKDILQLKQTAMQKRKEYLQDPGNVPTNPTETIWCADLTEDLSGNVGLVEVVGIRKTGLNIRPGYPGDSAYDGTRDGITTPAIAVKAPETYFNWAMQGGWQKWKPTYRWGTASNVDKNNDTCDVTLESATNPDTSKSVNQGGSLTGVTIEYMNCNAAAFEDGDEVLVEFTGQSWSSPKVIGFKDHPKGCWWEPWGATLCENHDYSDAIAVTNCVLNAHDSLVDDGSGNYKLTGALSWPGLPSGMYTWYVCDAPGDIPLTGADGRSKFIIKWDATLAGHVDGAQRVEIILRSSGSSTRIDLFGAAIPVVPASIPGYSEVYEIGFNADEEIEFDLSATSLSGNLTEVTILISCNSGTIDYWIDYIDFRAP